MKELQGRARARGSTRWYLNVKADNAPAIRLYESAGLAIEQRGWSHLRHLVGAWHLDGSTSGDAPLS